MFSLTSSIVTWVARTPRHQPMIISFNEAYSKVNIFLGLMEYELDTLLSAPDLVDYISWLPSRNFFRGQNLLLCKFLLLCYCFPTKFQVGGKVSEGWGKLPQGAPPAPSCGSKPVSGHILFDIEIYLPIITCLLLN